MDLLLLLLRARSLNSMNRSSAMLSGSSFRCNGGGVYGAFRLRLRTLCFDGETGFKTSSIIPVRDSKKNRLLWRPIISPIKVNRWILPTGSRFSTTKCRTRSIPRSTTLTTRPPTICFRSNIQNGGATFGFSNSETVRWTLGN